MRTGKSHGCIDNVFVDQFVDESELARALCRDRFTADVHLERNVESDQARKPLGAAGSR